MRLKTISKKRQNIQSDTLYVNSIKSKVIFTMPFLHFQNY